MPLYRIDFERTERAHIYVEADGEAEVEALINDDIHEALSPAEWYVGDDPETEYDVVTTTHGQRYWSGPPIGGGWVDPSEAAS